MEKVLVFVERGLVFVERVLVFVERALVFAECMFKTFETHINFNQFSKVTLQRSIEVNF